MDTTTSSTLATSPPDAARPGSGASSEVIAKRTRRRFSLAYKRRIVALVAGLPAGEVGALLRRERLYSSHLTAWRQQLAELDAAVVEPRRGRKPDPKRPERLRIEKLEHELAKAQQRLQHAEAIIDAQKKLCALLGLPSSERQP
jgi:transposase-like protein